TIAAEPIAIIADAGQRERPGPRRIGVGGGGQGPLEELCGPPLQAPAARASHTRAQGSERAAVGILRAGLLEPAAVETHEVPKAILLRIERVVDERRVGGGQVLNFKSVVAGLLQQYRQKQRPPVVIRA